LSQNVLIEFSEALKTRAEEARGSVAAILGRRRPLSAIVWRDDLLVTSAQSLRRRERYEIATSTGVAEATLAGEDPATNVALLKLAAPLKANTLAARAPVTGELALVYGANRSGELRAKLGVVSAVGEAWHSSRGGLIDHRIGLDVDLRWPDEGGPAFGADGSLIGMTTFGPFGRAIAIPTATIERIVPLLEKDGRIARGWLGIALQPVAVPEAFRGEDGQTSALMAMSVEANGPAAKAGVLAGDIVLSVDGQTTERFRKIVSRLGPESVGKNVELRIVRGGAVQTLPLTVEARPAS